MTYVIQILLILVLGMIFFQDLRWRWVRLPLLLLAIAGFGLLHGIQAGAGNFIRSVTVNTGIIALVIAILYLYSRIRLKSGFLNQSFGAGDLLFFIAVALGFPTVPFVVLFVFSVFFALLLHLFTSWKPIPAKAAIPEKEITVPLAGYMALFFAFVLMCSFMTDIPLYVNWR